MDVPDMGRNSYLADANKKVDRVKLEKLNKDKNKEQNRKSNERISKNKRLKKIEDVNVGSTLDVEL